MGNYICVLCGQFEGYPVLLCSPCQFAICPKCSPAWTCHPSAERITIAKMLITSGAKIPEKYVSQCENAVGGASFLHSILENKI